MKPIRILQVLNSMNLGGAETFIINIFRNLDRNKIQFDFMLHDKDISSYEKEIISLGGKIFRFPKYKIFNHYNYCKKLNDFLKEHIEYKIIHCHQYNIASVVLNIAKKNNRITVCHSHNTRSDLAIKGFVKSLYRKNLNNVTDYAFACSADAGKYLYKNREFKVINNGIDTEKFTYNYNISQKIRKELNIPADSVVFGHVGRFMTVKNHSFLIDIFNDYNKINSNSYLVLIGDGVLKENIIKKTKFLGLENKVLFLGLRSDVNEILQAIDLFLFPSIYEGLPVTLIEAQATGLKCLVSDRVTKDVNITGNISFLPINQGTESWIKEINNSLGYERNNMNENIVEAGYDMQNIAKELEDFYLNNYR